MPRRRYTFGVSGVKSNQYLPRFIRASNKRRMPGVRGTGREEEPSLSDSRITLQARLTGYRKAGGNSIPTCTGVPSEKLFRVHCSPRKGRGAVVTTFYALFLSLSLPVFSPASFIKRHRRLLGAPRARRMTSKRHVCGKRRAWRSWSLRIETLRALRPIAPYAL